MRAPIRDLGANGCIVLDAKLKATRVGFSNPFRYGPHRARH